MKDNDIEREDIEAMCRAVDACEEPDCGIGRCRDIQKQLRAAYEALKKRGRLRGTDLGILRSILTDRARSEEREAIVAWLRKLVANSEEDDPVAAAVAGIVVRIERGDHLKREPDPTMDLRDELLREWDEGCAESVALKQARALIAAGWRKEPRNEGE